MTWTYLLSSFAALIFEVDDLHRLWRSPKSEPTNDTGAATTPRGLHVHYDVTGIDLGCKKDALSGCTRLRTILINVEMGVASRPEG